jgi:DsbC/DsbD-like thiol-disulfide interchange protein
MKKIYISAAALLFSISAYTQILAPVKWAYAAKKTGKDEAVILVKATIDNGWHIYSQHGGDEGPVKTALKFTPSDTYALAGVTAEPEAVKKYEKAFDMQVSYFEKSVVFQQKVKLKTNNPVIKGTITYMVCSNKECLPPEDVEFNVAVN